MKKHGNYILIAAFVLVGFAAGMLLGEAMARMPSGTHPAFSFALFLALLYAILLLQIALHEAGHWLFGALSGYRFVSYRIFGLMWLKDDRGVRFARFSLAGTGGQCLMDPPPLENLPVTLYNLGGALLNLISAAVCFALSFLCSGKPVAWTICCESALIGLVFALLNGIPMRLNMLNNDGMNALELRRDPEARRAFWIQLKSNAETSRGVRLSDMPAEWFVCPDAKDMKNGLVASLGFLAAQRLMAEEDFERADALMARLQKNPGALPGLYLIQLTNERIFCELIGKNRPESVDALNTPAHKKAIKALKKHLFALRTQYALARLHERDDAKAEALRKQFDATAKRYPYPQEVEDERRLFARVDDIAGRRLAE